MRASDAAVHRHVPGGTSGRDRDLGRCVPRQSSSKKSSAT